MTAISQTEIPRVSVVMPVYNAERYLREAVESILNQTFTDFEFIIIDDGSTDGSLKILREYADKDPRIRLISRENRGITPTLNEGIDLARGEYIARMDADDVSLPERFARQMAYMEEHPECVVCGSYIDKIDPYGVLIKAEDRPLDHDAIESRLLEEGTGGIICHPVAMIRKTALVEAGKYRAEYVNSQDLDLWLRLARLGHLANIPHVLLQYRQHPASISVRNSAKQRYFLDCIMKEAYSERGLSIPVSPPWKRWKGAPPAHRCYMQWGWAALRHGRRDIAFKHAKASLILRPITINTWKLLFCILRGY